MTSALALLLVALGTYALRAGSVRLLGDRPVPPTVTRGLHHAAIAIMAALAVTSLPSDGGVPTVRGAVAATVTGLAARRTRHLPLLLAIGIGAGLACELAGLS